jgi:hydroxymethylpyrimidine/phosphomethylpyrimidine kinase
VVGVNAPFCILTIAGSDSGGGAGIQADQRTIRAIGGHALTAITAVTAQDTRSISAWKPVPDALIRAQIDSALGGYPVAAIKTGLLPGPGAVRAVALALAKFPSIPLVVDPVLSSTSGSRFLSSAGIKALRRMLFPRAFVITANWPEAATLTGRPVRSHAQAEKAAARLSEECGRPVLVKGGHAKGMLCRDCLALPGGETLWFEAPRVATVNTHGTGCVLSAAIAAWLGRGASLPDAVRFAQSFLQRALIRGRGLDWGVGRGPAFYGAR